MKLKSFLYIIGIVFLLLNVGIASASLTDSLISYWKLDETEAGAVVDEQGTQNGTNVGATINQSGFIGQAYSFDGDNDHIDLVADYQNDNFDGVSGISVELWVKASSASDTRQIMYGKIDNTHTGFQMAILSGDNLYIGGRSEVADGYQEKTGTATVSEDGGWIHIVGSLDFANDKIYTYINGTVDIDGETVDFGSSTYSASTTTATDTLGNTASSYAGLMDNFRIYGKTLSPTEVLNLFKGNTAPVIIVNVTKPDVVYINTDWRLNITATDSEDSTFTAYTQFYVNGSISGSEIEHTIDNITSTNVANLSSSIFNIGDNLIAEMWVSDVDWNSTKINTSEITVQNSAPVISLNFPESGSVGQPINVILNVTVTDIDGDIMNVSFYSGYIISNDTWLSDDEEVVGQYQGVFTKIKTIEIISLSPSPTLLRIHREQELYNASLISSKIYKNGVAVTGEFQSSGNQTDDIEFAEGDTVELWALANSGEGKFRNFRVLGNNLFINNTANISNGSYVTYEWSGLDYNTTYDWYASATDEVDRTSNEVWNFTTYSPSISGIVKDSSNVVVNNATVIIINQLYNTIVGITDSNSTGGWIYYIGNIGTYLVVAYDPNNSTRDGDADPHIVVS